MAVLAPVETGRVRDGAVRAWLLAVAMLVFAMVIVGGATRLTDSGLSITEWKPLLGAIPPMTDQAWQEAFAKYKEIPQAQIVNPHMTVETFKFIYWWEWSHRQLGRLIGVAFALPLVVFALTGALRQGLGTRLAGILALGGLQGFIGWFMVQSGLEARVDVSPYRLALHLSVAVLIFGALLWTEMDLTSRGRNIRLVTLSATQRRLSAVLVAAIFLQIILGAFVAGMKAGNAFNTWPLMDGHIIPAGIGELAPWWHNITENPATVQFDHRIAAYLVAVLVVVHALAVARQADDERLVHSAFVMVAIVTAQIGLGVWTVLASVPLWLGLAHQGGALILFAAALWHRHRVMRSMD